MELYFRYDCDQSIDEVCNSKDDGTGVTSRGHF